MNYRKIIEDCGGVLDEKETGEHYVYASARHGRVYIEKRRFLKDPVVTNQLADGFVEKLWECFSDHIEDEKSEQNMGYVLPINVFLGAQMCGAKFVNYVATSYLNSRTAKTGSYVAQKKILCLEAEKKIIKKQEILFLRDEYKKDIKGKKVFIVEDIINTGKTIFKLIDLVCEAGGEVIGVGAIWDRGNVDQDAIFEYVCRYGLTFCPAFFSLVTEKLESCQKDECQSCKQRIPISKEHGHG